MGSASKKWAICVLMLVLSASAWSADTPLPGVNISGAEFGGDKLPGRNGFTYLWPTDQEIQRFADAGFRVVRIPFRWERLQPELGKPLNDREASYLDALVRVAARRKLLLVIDPHNYGAFGGKLIGSEEVTTADFADFWARVAERYKRYPNVVFGLMNEPNKQTSTEWAAQAQAAIDAIRSAGAKQLVLVPGTHWSGAHSWTKADAFPSNAVALADIKDSESNFAFELHEYMDADSSGTHKECVSEDIGVKRLAEANAWLRKHNKRGFLGEFGVSAEPLCLKALDKTVQFLNDNRDVWLGWSYWSASKWGARYMFDIYPLDTENQKQFAVLQRYLTQPVQ